MPEIRHHILVTLTPSKEFLSLTRKRSKNLKALAVLGVGYAIWSEIERRKQEETIYQLSVRVKKLERNEGE